MSYASLRQEVLRKFPELKPQRRFPLQALWFAFLLPAIVALSALAARHAGPHALLATAEALALGLLYSSLGLLTHELLHGSILKLSPATRVISWFGFLVFGLSPEAWLTWHNRVHHFHTNEAGVDPDSFGLWRDFQKLPMSSFVLKRAPGSGHPLSWLYLPLNFNNQALTVTWYFLWKGDRRLYKTCNRPLAVAETLLMYAFWAAVAIALGGRAFVFVFLVPMLVANLVVSSYILVQHLFCPLTDENDPLENTLGVTTLRFLDLIHFRFSHHVEHHIFPEMNHAQLARARELLSREYKGRYRCMSHAKALKILLSGPRVYRDETTLLDPRTGRTLSVARMGR
ncbi:MAG: fatty acid desaturase [Deltaproteobacteria bacterium]|nr:fatty acid desaturase [Deltaproteobacteria bacterium]